MNRNHFLLLKKLKNTESAQLWIKCQSVFLVNDYKKMPMGLSRSTESRIYSKYRSSWIFCAEIFFPETLCWENCPGKWQTSAIVDIYDTVFARWTRGNEIGRMGFYLQEIFLPWKFTFKILRYFVPSFWHRPKI